MSVHIDVWLRELSHTGLPPTAQQELLAQLAPTIDCRARYFPDAPGAYLARVKDLLISALLPQKGPLSLTLDSSSSPERMSRCSVWELVYLELSPLDGSRRPVDELHIFSTDVICMMARSEFPLTVPPRWLSELF